MPLALSCDCGARFEVEDTLAGQAVACPECRRSVTSPAPSKVPVRTSGYALASVLASVLLMFTVVGTLLGVLLGLVGLVSIARNRDRLAGTGYAYFGIVWGLVFTGITIFALHRGEVFGLGDQLRQGVRGGQVDRSGPMEIVEEDDGFSITRPSAQWGVARPELMTAFQANSSVMLANIGKDAYVAVSVETVGKTSLVKCREDVVASFRDGLEADLFGGKNKRRTQGFKLRESRRLPPVGSAGVEEVLLDVRMLGQPWTFLVRVIKDEDSDTVYVLKGWAHARRYPEMQAEIHKAMDSFRLLRG